MSVIVLLIQLQLQLIYKFMLLKSLIAQIYDVKWDESLVKQITVVFPLTLTFYIDAKRGQGPVSKKV